MKNSPLLSELMELSKKMHGSICTAECFIIAIMDKLTAEKNYQNPEMEDVELLIRSVIPDFRNAKMFLLDEIQKSKLPFLDDLYMKRTLEKVIRSQPVGTEELTAAAVLKGILDNPSEKISPILSNNISFSSEEDVVANSVGKTFEDLYGQQEQPSDAETLLDETSDSFNEREQQAVKEQVSELVAATKKIRKELADSVFGQENAINVFANGFFQASMLSLFDKKRKRPQATFLFAGPPGVGKTFLAEVAAGALNLPFERFDMSEYADKEAHLKFCGMDDAYKNAKEGTVTGFVRKNPKSVLLFDEIEKAHINVIHLFLQMLDAGRLRDNYHDEEISFKDTIIILTTNAGKQLYTDSLSGDLSSLSRKVIVKALQTDVHPVSGTPLFPGAICSRFASGNVVMFNHIGAHNLRTIARKEMLRHAKNLEEQTGIALQIEESVYTALLLAEGASVDARTIRGRAETFFNNELYELLRMVDSQKVKTDINQLEEIRIRLDLEDTSAEISTLFDSEDKAQALVFADDDIAETCAKKAPDAEIFGVQSIEEAVEVLRGQEVDFVLVDMRFGASESDLSNLNIEDVDSPARDFFRFMLEQHEAMPVYLLETGDTLLTEEEKVSFMRCGVRGVLRVSEEKEKDTLGVQLNEIATVLHQQANMVKLARENKIISFGTAQTISENGKIAEIKLYDFKQTVAVDSEDSDSVLRPNMTSKVLFKEVIGATEAKKELQYFVEYLKNPKKYLGTGVKPPRGVILYGPPGTGKTMLAKAMANEAGVTFLSAEGNQFVKKYVGEGSSEVHELFATARKYAPAILFIDEIDAIAKARTGENRDGTEGTLTAFLTEMDGFSSDPSKPVFVLAATNFDVTPGSPKSLDAALMRRFDRRVYIDLPNKADRIRFMKMKVEKNRALEISEEQIENIAMRSTGMSLAELDSAFELALRSAIRQESTKVTDSILEEAFETFHGGEVKKWDVSQLERVARHEAGHALLCYLGGETPSYLTIVARGKHGGYMQHAEQEGKEIYTKEELLANVRTSLGGRAAELVCYGAQDGISTGASGDLYSATRLVRHILCAYGMDDDFGLAVDEENGAMSAEVRASVNRILKAQMQEAIRLITENKDRLDALVDALMSKNHLNGPEIEKILSGK